MILFSINKQKTAVWPLKVKKFNQTNFAHLLWADFQDFKPQIVSHINVSLVNLLNYIYLIVNEKRYTEAI